MTETVKLYRIENPTIPARHNPDTPLVSSTSHPDIVGQWFSPNLATASHYLRKSTQTFGKDAHPVDGAQLVIVEVPTDKLSDYHVSQHPTAKHMDVEGDNYIIPRDGSAPIQEVPLDPIIEDLKGRLGNIQNLQEAQRRIAELVEGIGQTATSQ